MKPSVAVTSSTGHYEGVFNALRLVEEEVKDDIRGKKKVLVKPNFVSTTRQLAATRVDAVKAVLDVITKYHSGRIIFAEGPAGSSLKDALANFDYLQLQDDYDIEFVDLNRDDYVEVEGFDAQLRPLKFRLSKTIVESDYRISVALPKTHDTVIVTLSIKNMVVGSLLGNHKSRIHQGYKAINLNIAKLAQTIMPHLGVIDGFVGMEGSGPVGGDPINLGMAAASFSPVSLDAVVTKIMGFNPSDIGYLHHLHEWKKGVIDLNEIEIIGASVDDVSKNFQPHPNYPQMLSWK